MKQFIDGLLAKSPVQLISSIYAVIAAAGAFLLTLQKQLDGVTGWGQASIIIAAALLALLQGYTTKPQVFTDHEVGELTSEAHTEGQKEGRREALAYAAQKRKDAAAKAAQTRAARMAKPAKTGRR